MELTSASEGNLGSKSHIKKRVENACQACKPRKRRCDGNLLSCSACRKQGLSCIYLQARKRGKGKVNAYVQNLERKIASLEDSLLRSGLIQDQGSPRPSYASDHRSDEIATKTLGSTSEFESGDVRPLVNTDGRSSTPLPPTEECLTSWIVGQAYETSISGSDLPTPKSSIGTNSEILTVRERLFASLPGEDIARRLRDQIRRGPFTSSIFTNPPPKAHLESLFELSYDNINCQWPLFDPSNLIPLLDEQYASDSSSIHKSPARWALLNSAIAIAIQSRAAEDSYSDMTDLSWHFFKNSYSVFPAIVSRGTDILALEALLAMALFMQGSSDARTTSLLISEASRLFTTLGFHKSSFYVGMEPITAERHKRAFWIAYILDKDISIKTGMPSAYNDDDISLGYTSSDSLGCPGKIVASDIRVEATVFRLRAQLAVIESAIQNQLYSKKTTKCGAERCLQAVAELDYRLGDWKGQVPLNIQPGHINWSTVRPLREPILSLHFVYYRAMGAVHSFAVHIMPINDVKFLSQSISSDSIHATMAHESIQLLQFLPPQAPGDLWQTLFHPLSAFIALVAIVLKQPTDVRAQSHLRHISDFVKLLVNVEKCGVLHIEHMLHLCIQLEKLVFETVTAETNVSQSTKSSVGNQILHAKAQRLTSHEAFYGNHMQLAQGLMGNIPPLQAIAANVFYDMLPAGAKSSSTAGVLAPALLNPETYQFAFT